jgi:hypothetical protein
MEDAMRSFTIIHFLFSIHREAVPPAPASPLRGLKLLRIILSALFVVKIALFLQNAAEAFSFYTFAVNVVEDGFPLPLLGLSNTALD